MKESKKRRKKALVLSGGAAYGAFQIGALRYLLEEYKHADRYGSWEVVAGVSVGALNGTMIALKEFSRLKRVWATISNRKVYTGKFWTPRVLAAAVLSWKSILGNKPLKKLIKKEITDEMIKRCDKEYQDEKGETYPVLLIGCVSLATGKYYAFEAKDFAKHPESFREAILASTSIPLFWPPVRAVRDDRGRKYYHLVDGGPRNVSPLGDVIKYDFKHNLDIEEIVVINCDPHDVKVMEESPKNLGKIAVRSITEIMVNEIFNADIREHLRINHLVDQAKKKKNLTLYDNDNPISKKRKLKSYDTVVIQPDCPEKLGSSLEFSNEWVNRRINFGMEMAERALLERDAKE